MSVKVCKFGGTSLADASQFRKVHAIIKDDPQRRYIVPSAPGKRHESDQKITDLLYLCHSRAQQAISFENVFALIADRFLKIATDLNLSLKLKPHLEKIKAQITASAAAHAGSLMRSGSHPEAYAASRGEYLNGLLLSELLGFSFVDPIEVIRFDAEGGLDWTTTHGAMIQRLSTVDRAVIPGFYGGSPDGGVQTFSRGGSDVSGALVAAGVEAAVYENWTDVSGVLMADPHIVPNPKVIDVLTYRELRELAYMGARVLHDEAIFPVREAQIPVNIRNTNEPYAPGTMIVPEAASIAHLGTISGIAGRKDFTVIAVEKALMNREVGFGRRLLSVLESHGISYEHTPSGIDTMSVVAADAQLEGKLDTVIQDIQHVCNPDALDTYPGMALVATVGRGMAHTPGMAGRLFGALSGAGVNIRMIDQGSSELNIIVGVESSDLEKSVCAIYKAFVD